jgi:gliding motility-associated-like protein
LLVGKKVWWLTQQFYCKKIKLRALKYQICILFLLFFADAVQAQKEANTWYFGRFSGISFDQTPPRALTDGMIISEEGSASISDKNGNLLFYTNGLIVVNAQQLMMKNGGNLLGDRNSTQNAVIVPQPGNDSLYYIFTVGIEGQPEKGLRYSVVNMNRDNGLGEVVQANMPLCGDCYEKVAAVRACNRKDVWIVSRSYNDAVYRVYKLTSQGIEGSVTSSSGFNIGTNPFNTIGAIKFSPDGKKLGVVYGYDADRVELLDFDPATGVLSNPIIFKPDNIPGPPTVGGAYGLEFSPNSRLLYVTANDYDTDSSFLYQFDFSSGNAAGVLASRQVISVTTLNNLGNIQIGPDNKLYAIFFGNSHLSVIDNPDVPGAGCNFVRQGVSLNSTLTRYGMVGLPTFMASIFNPLAQPYGFSRVPGSCSDLNVGFMLDNTVGVDSVRWFFGDGAQPSKQLAPFHLYAAPGYYDVNLVVYKVDCSGLNDTITRRIWIAPAGLLGPDVSGCVADSITIAAPDISGAVYLWNTGDRIRTIKPRVSGQYWLDLQQNNCVISDTINVIINESPIINIGPDTSVCAKNPIELDAGITGGAYTWNTGAISQKITVSKPGTYIVKVTQNGCQASDTAEVDQGDCEFFIPNSFTPNGDGINDNFGLIGATNYNPFSFRIYSRWGQTVFRAVSSGQRWDGSFKGLDMPAGAYPWIIDYTNKKGQPVKLKGVVLLMR